MTPSKSDFKANSADRLLPGEAASRADAGRYLAPFAVCVAYAGFALLLVLHDRPPPGAAPTRQEIPVEIVVEPPPPKKPEPPAKPTPKTAQPFNEKPAFDAPRPPDKKKIDADGPDKTPKAPDDAHKAAAPPKPPAPTPKAEKAAEQAKTGKSDAISKPAKAAEDKAAAETIPTPERNGEEAESSEAPKEAEAAPETPAAADIPQFPTFESVPDIDFGRASEPSPIAGGKAQATYLSILYGMIMARVPKSFAAHATSRAEGTIIFVVDARGNVLGRRIARESGSRELDVAAFEAVRRASPFPPPPGGASVTLRFTYGAE